MKTVIGLPLFIAIYSCLSGGVFGDLTATLRDTEVKVGHSTFLNCSTDTHGEIRWSYVPAGTNRRQYIYAWGQINGPYKDRFKIDINSATGAYNLVIQNVNSTDAGRYTCQDKNGTGNHSAAELIVLESAPECGSDVDLDDVVGPNSCNVSPDDHLQLDCRIRYQGNVPPVMEWKMKGDSNPITHGVSRRPDSGPNITSVSLALKPDPRINGSTYICQTTRSTKAQISCTTRPIRIGYVIENITEISVEIGDEVTCTVNSSESEKCSYAWFNDRGVKVSSDRILKTNRLGSHECKARCKLRNTDCQVTAMRIYVIPPPTDPPGNITTTGSESSSLLPVLLPLGLLLVLAVVAIPILVFVFKRKNKRSLIQQRTELDARLYEMHQGVSETIRYADEPTVIDTIYAVSSFSGRPQKIRGMTILDGSLFVVTYKSKEVIVFDSTNFKLQRHFELQYLVDAWDIVSCRKRNCLYIMDAKEPNSTEKEILRVDPSGQEMQALQTKKDAGYLSVTAEGHVILAVFNKNLLKIFDPEKPEEPRWRVNVGPTTGQKIHPHHAVKLNTGDFLVIHGVGDSLHRVCIINDQGTVIREFGGKKGSDNTQMNLPKYLAVDRRDSVMVLDQNNHRIVLLSFNLQFQKELIARKHGLISPCRIYLDETTGHLLVAQDDTILVFNVLPQQHKEEDEVNEKSKLNGGMIGMIV